MATYPGGIRTFIDAATKAGQPLADGHVAAHVELADELRAVQSTLGVNPQGSHATVAARLAAGGGGGGGVTITDHNNGTATVTP